MSTATVVEPPCQMFKNLPIPREKIVPNVRRSISVRNKVYRQLIPKVRLKVTINVKNDLRDRKNDPRAI